MDMAPTILNYAGIEAPANMDGEDLRLLIENPKKFKRETIALTNMWGHDETQAMGVVSKDWKYIFWNYEDDRMKPTEELFHIGKDRLEMTNKANDPSEEKQLQKMRSIYDEHLDKLKKEAITEHLYQKYAVLFDRNATAEEKKPYLTGKNNASPNKSPSKKKNKTNKKKKNNKKKESH